ncbi:PAS domain S-box protein [Halorussus marinus]|uniref:PAS domain S-box protein n=1 Tax=Halorussus marinus TaxID=2505976 RepID=UPI00143D8D0E|nr:PAS domain S-box protein [Halorussus marinus]
MTDELRDENRKIEELHEVASRMQACDSKPEAYRLGVEAAEEILEFDICGIDEVEDGSLVPQATSTEMPADGYDTIDTDTGLAGRTYRRGESFSIPDVRAMDAAEPIQDEYRSILSVPVGDRGVFQAGSRETDAFDEDDVRLAELLMSHVGEGVDRIESQAALRESEQKYRTLVEGSHDAIFIHGDGSFEFVNDRVAELTGYDREELLGLSVWELVHEDDRERAREFFEGTESEDGAPHEEIRIRTDRGEVRHLDVSVQTISYGDDTAYLGSARDVTDRRERERTVKRQNEQLREFTSVVSHDLRNPLNVAQGYLDLARETGDPEHFEKAERALDRMESLTGELLELARQGHDVDETERLDLESVVRRAWAVVSTGEADLVVADGLGRLDADENRLRELFENLFRNSIDHAGRDVTVEVGPLCGPAAADRPAEGFYVVDDGPGITESERELVFERGYTTAEDGSGFGLAIVDDIVNAHGWDVAVRDGDAGGVRFEITTG